MSMAKKCGTADNIKNFVAEKNEFLNTAVC